CSSSSLPALWSCHLQADEVAQHLSPQSVPCSQRENQHVLGAEGETRLLAPSAPSRQIQQNWEPLCTLASSSLISAALGLFRHGPQDSRSARLPEKWADATGFEELQECE
ncbi:hypothetical protein HaLaN_30078, partial [Haematococcus lacustris]